MDSCHPPSRAAVTTSSCLQRRAKPHLGAVELTQLSFPWFPYSVISMACFGNASHKATITAKGCFRNGNHLSELPTLSARWNVRLCRDSRSETPIHRTQGQRIAPIQPAVGATTNLCAPDDRPFAQLSVVPLSPVHSVITPFGASLFANLHVGDAHLTAGSSKLQGSCIARGSQQRSHS
jgi:hypothetical protein